MLVFWKKKLVFLAVPKTGTTAIEAALARHADTAIRHPPHMKHVPVQGYRNRLAGFFEQRGSRPMEVMAVIREPIDWLGSWYRYRSRPEIADTPQSTQGLSFDQFVEAWLKRRPPEFARVGRQSTFVTDKSGQIGVDHLFTYEELDLAVAFLEQRLEVALTLPRRNVSPQADLTLSPRIEARLREEAAADFDLWRQVADGT
jgi:hypothetical protein